MEAWDTSKENFQPLRQGRDPRALQEPIPAPTKEGASNSRDAEHRDHLRAIEAYQGDDPIEPWLSYIAWIRSSYPTGLDRVLLPALEHCTRDLAATERYRTDVRYLRLWVQYADLLRDPLDVFLFLRDRNIGQDHALFFEAFAVFLERQGAHSRAREVYEEGVLRRAQPVDRLRQKLADFEARMEMRRKRRLESGMPAEPEPERFALSSLQARSRALSAPRPGAGTLSGATGALGGAVAGQGAPGLGNAGGPSLDVFQDDEASLGRGGLPAAGGGAFRGGLAGVGERSKENVMRASEWSGVSLRPQGTSAVGPAPELEVFEDEDVAPTPARSGAPVPTLRQRIDMSTAAFEEIQKDPLRAFLSSNPAPPALPVPAAAPAEPRGPVVDAKRKQPGADAAREGHNATLLAGGARCFEEARLEAWARARGGEVPREVERAPAGVTGAEEPEGEDDEALDVSMSAMHVDDGAVSAPLPEAVRGALREAGGDLGSVTVNTKEAMMLIDSMFSDGGAAAGGEAPGRGREAVERLAAVEERIAEDDDGGLGIYEDTVFLPRGQREKRGGGEGSGSMALDIREDTCFLQPGPSYVAPATAAPVTGPRPAPLAPSPDKENLEPPAPSPEAQAGAAPSSTPRGPAAPAHFDPDAENADPTGEGGVEAGEGRALPPRELGDEGVEACVLRPLSKERAEAMGVEVTGGEDGAAAGHGSSPGASQSPAQAMRAVPERTRDPFVVFEDKGSPGRAPGAAVIADAFSDALLARMMTAAGLDRPGAPPPGAFVALTAGECEAALEAVREAEESGMGMFELPAGGSMVVQGAEEGGLTATIMREDEDEGPFLAAVTPLSRAVWECHVAQRIEEAAGSAAARLVSRPTHMVPLGSGRGALALYPREDDVTMARVLQAHGDARGVGEALALWYAAQVLRILAALHVSAVVHGNIHPGTLAVVPAPSHASAPGLLLTGLSRSADMGALPPGSLLRGRGSEEAAWCWEMRGGDAWSHGADNHACATVLRWLVLGEPYQGPLPSEPPRPMAAWSDWRHVIQGLEGLPRNRAAPEMVQALASAVEARAAGADMVSALPVEAMRQNVLMHGST